ncbi:LysR family transcriptional regulator [Halomonas sp. ISL-60]|uniref:helix-turn-helix domain-containing protein n=1 Tax=Halomonas sp. ISL-56 TaxID=2819149 RepID=UPI001BE56353|nr:LysR family transcriptional regulator [Halomonas sp. ISL-56]MBT2773747.1 LysR family transcriptional regulator [Halomonas sp. ISL-60]MBT2801782.1 LysR family transcriptional regulator [Halomonas sp. ISL-56]
MLDLNEIALFVPVVRNGSFTETARRLGTPSNTLSHRLQKLENQLGTRLLQRPTRKLTLLTLAKHFTSSA